MSKDDRFLVVAYRNKIRISDTYKTLRPYEKV